MIMRILHPCLPIFLSGVGLAAPQIPGEWGSWRGPDGTGVAPEANPPTEWSEDRNVRWKVPIPGVAISSPIVWKQHVYLTTAIETERQAEPTNLEPHDPRSNPPPTAVYEFAVLAIERANGRVAWRTPVREIVPHEGGHANNTQASSSPITDGEHIYVNFGSRGIYCLDMDGEVRWSKDLGLMRTRYQYGEGTSPAIHGDTLIVNRDQEDDSFIVAFDKRTGEELWRRPRSEASSWATPAIAPVDGRHQVIITGWNASRSYDLRTGEMRWSLPGMTELCIPSPVYGGGIVYLMSGYPDFALQAVRLAGAEGDLTDSSNLLWSYPRNTSYVSSPVLYEGHLYFVRFLNGVLSCLDARTGEVHYEGERLSGLRRVLASPVAASGRIYVASAEGVTKVIRHGPTFEELATNHLDDGFEASPAIAGNEIYLRGREYLYCIAER